MCKNSLAMTTLASCNQFHTHIERFFLWQSSCNLPACGVSGKQVASVASKIERIFFVLFYDVFGMRGRLRKGDQQRPFTLQLRQLLSLLRHCSGEGGLYRLSCRVEIIENNHHSNIQINWISFSTFPFRPFRQSQTEERGA